MKSVSRNNRSVRAFSFAGKLAALLVAFFFLGHQSVNALTLTLKPEAQISEKKLFLGDLIEVVPGMSADLLAVSLGDTPDFREARLITPAMIEMAIREQTKLTDPISWDGAKACNVYRPYRLVSSQDLVAVITPALARATNNQGAVEIQEFADLSPMQIPAGHAQAEVELNPTALTSAWTNATVNFMVDGETVLSRSVRFQWTWQRCAWVAKQALQPGTHISPDDFIVAKVDGIAAGTNIVSDPKVFQEYTLAKPLSAGQVLGLGSLALKKLILKGGIVQVHYNSPTFSISMAGIAMEDGTFGSTITVMNASSHSQILARVIDESNLEFVQKL